MKRLFAILLAGLMLFGFGVCSSAQTPEALLTQTMRDLGENYALEGSFVQGTRKDYIAVIHVNGAYAFIREDGVRDIHLKDRIVRAYPERNAWHVLSLSHGSKYLPLLEPKAIPQTITAESNFGVTEISFGGNRYWYREGMLWSIDGGPAPEILIEAMRNGAGAISLEGMREVPRLMKWAWEPRENFALFLEEHPMFNNMLGGALSAGLTTLVIVLSPLLGLLVMVLRALDYLGIFRV